ncbi:hypothetical protein E3E12_04840 [Formicincola oecophyllae]|uniref:DEAD box helicase DbpA/CsdA RNA-binding domain-containing protein n=2 Tax=Formicincola oecophyllae TaxID=2558361 RepID=A0A4Y6UDB3_9PROT|nr:hypothetical protein E3E12_04840 [Formicincola oecophyllae]
MKDGRWYRLAVGREGRADPKWLLPMLCRVGGLQKRDIGSIRIAPDHTLFQIAADKADRFDAARAANQDADVPAITPATAPKDGGARRPFGGQGGGRFGKRDNRGPRRSFGGSPFRGRS